MCERSWNSKENNASVGFFSEQEGLRMAMTRYERQPRLSSNSRVNLNVFPGSKHATGHGFTVQQVFEFVDGLSIEVTNKQWQQSQRNGLKKIRPRRIDRIPKTRFYIVSM